MVAQSPRSIVAVMSGVTSAQDRPTRDRRPRAPKTSARRSGDNFRVCTPRRRRRAIGRCPSRDNDRKGGSNAPRSPDDRAPERARHDARLREHGNHAGVGNKDQRRPPQRVALGQSGDVFHAAGDAGFAQRPAQVVADLSNAGSTCCATRLACQAIDVLLLREGAGGFFQTRQPRGHREESGRLVLVGFVRPDG